MRDTIAKRLWTGEVEETDGRYTVGNLSGSRKSVQKNEGQRRGTVPNQILTPFRGQARPFNPFSLRKLAKTEAVQASIDHIIGDLQSIEQGVQDVDPETPVGEDLHTVTKDHLENISPNDESGRKLNEMWWRDLLEVGNCVGVKTYNIDGKRVEVNPLDPDTFTLEWDANRVITGYWQYAQGGGLWGEPTPFDTDEIIWETLNPETRRAGHYGHSPTEKVQRVVNILGGLMDSEETELEEGMPPGIVSLTGDWSDKDYKRFEDYWENNVKGESHKVPLAKGEAKFEPFTMSYKDLQILDRQKWYYKLVGAIFMVPVSENGLAIGEQMTRATDVSQRQRYKNKRLRPLLEQRQETWTHEVIQEVFTEDLEYRFDPSLDLMEKKEIVSMLSSLMEMGAITINEARNELGYESKEWGEDPPQGGSAPGDGPDGGDGGGSPESALQDALTEGMEPMQETDVEVEERLQQDFNKSQSGCDCSGDLESVSQDFDVESCIESVMSDGASREEAEAICYAQYHEQKAEEIAKDLNKPLREGGDHNKFNFQPKEIEALLEDVAELYREQIEDVMSGIRGKRGQWTAKSSSGAEVQKSLNEFLQVVDERITTDFNRELATILATHKTRKILDGEDTIAEELSTAGLDPEDVLTSEMSDRIGSRIERRTLEVVEPISERLEEDLKSTIGDGWTEGLSIEEIESNIEDLTDKWQGHEAERLARDQLGRASKEGRLEYAKETESEVGGWYKQWITNIDGRERESHAAMDGETVPREEPFVVDYSEDGGPTSVEEEYPGDSAYGIQCRCDYELIPQAVVEKVRKWEQTEFDDHGAREEVQKSTGVRPWEALLHAEILVKRYGHSRNQVWKSIGLGSKATYYKWIKSSGLYQNGRSVLE